MNILTDIELEQRAADGESDAFGVLYERYSPRVYDFLLRMVRETAEAADLTQETFVRAMRSMKAERAGKAEFSTWLFTIARNLALTRLERAKRTEPLADEGEDDSAYYRFDPDRLDNPEVIAQASEIASLVWEASEALDPKQRTLLDLHVRQGLDSAEIATVLGVSKGNAYTMMSRLKDTFESAVAGLVMFRAGRRNCPELNRLLEDNGATQISPDVRKLIERHTKSCDTCQGKRRELVSAAALLRALVPMPLLPGLANQIRDGAWTQAQQAGAASAGSGAGGAGGAAGGGYGGGLLSMPARALHALPGPAWLPAVAAVLVVAVAVPAAVFTMRSDGGGSKDSAPRQAGAKVSSAGASRTSAIVAAVTPPARSAPDAVSAGGSHTCALIAGGVWCWGANGAGQLGDSNTTDSSVPVAVSGMTSGVSAISAGGGTTCAIKGGGAWCWGANDKGQLGNNSTAASSIPAAVPGLASGVSNISVGVGTTCAVKDAGAWCWGANGKGQLGNNGRTESLVPVEVTGLAIGVSAISAHGNHACAVKDGGVWCWGQNSLFGSLGNNSTADSLVPVVVSGLADGVSAISVGTNATCALKDGGVWCWGDNFNGKLGISGGANPCGADPCSRVPLPVSGMASGVSDISTDGNYTCVVKDNAGSCRGMGHGIGRTAPPNVSGLTTGVSAISVGGNHACALKDGDVWCWGVSDKGQLGNNSRTNSTDTPVAVLGLPRGASVPTPAGEQAVSGTPDSSGNSDEDRLMAAVRATYPSIDFTPTCTIDSAHLTCGRAGPWSPETLAAGIAPFGLEAAEAAARIFFGRMADGSWGYWATISNGGGGPLVSLPGEAVVCADGDGLNLRAAPSTSATAITLIPDGAVVRTDQFALNDPGTPGTGGSAAGHGWYHLVSPQEGWAADRFLVPNLPGAEYGCLGWWHRAP